MLVKNSFEYDARVRKEAESLIGAGYDVTVVAIHVPGITAERETLPSGVHVIRVNRILRWFAGLAGPSTVTPGARSSTRRWLGWVRHINGITGPPLRAVNNLVLNRRFVRTAVSIRPDFVHGHDLNTLAAAATVARKTGVPLIYDAHELHTHRNDMGAARRAWNHAAERVGLRRVDTVITSTDSYAEHIARIHRLPAGRRPVVVRNLPELLDPEPGWDLRERLGIPADRHVLLYQGSIQRNRGIEQIIESLHRLPDCVLVVIGYGAHRPALERLAHARGFGKRVRFFGPISNNELLRYTASADVGMCCIVNSSRSYYLSLPNKLFEYMMAGLPQVTSDFPEMGRIVRQLGVGEVCDPADPASIAAAVRRILDDPERALQYHRNARSAVTDLNWDVEKRRLLAAYRTHSPWTSPRHVSKLEGSH